MKSWIALLLVTAVAAQTDPPASSITGTVRDSVTGLPIADCAISFVLPHGDHFTSRTDAQGHYKLAPVPPGVQILTATGSAAPGSAHPQELARTIRVPAGETVFGIDFRLPQQGAISGTILNGDRHTVAGTSVKLLEKRYANGLLYYANVEATTSGANGEYSFDSVPAHRPLLLMVDSFSKVHQPKKDAGDDGKQPELGVAPTYYPASAFVEAAEEFVLIPGETRRRMDIRAFELPTFCVDGLADATLGPIKAVFVTRRENGPDLSSATINAAGPDQTGFRVCSLPVGEYLFRFAPIMSRPNGPLFPGRKIVIVSKADLHGLRIAASPLVELPWTAEWDGATPTPPIPVQPLLQARTWGRFDNTSASASLNIPGQGTIRNLTPDEYAINVTGLPSGVYSKELTFGNKRPLYETIRPSDGGVLRIVIARDGVTLHASVRDKDAKPVSDAYVAIMPVSAANEAQFAARTVIGQSDPSGLWTSGTLAPGKYLAIATLEAIDASAARISRLWAARPRATEIEIGPFGNAQINLEPRALR